MLVGTVIGVLVIPGLYYLFGRIADGRKLLQDEVAEPLSEIFEHPDEPLARFSNTQGPHKIQQFDSGLKTDGKT